MALVYVGGTSGVGTTATYAVSLSGTLTGGIASSPSQDDIVVVFSGFGNTAAVDPTCTGNNSGAYGFVTGTTSYHQNDTWDAEFAGRFAIQGATVDTSLTIGRAANAAYGGATVVQVWRGVDTTTPFDVTATVAGAGNTSLVNPPLITPTTAGTVILAGGTGTQTTAGSAFVVSSNMAGPSVTAKGDGTTSDTGTCIASHEWTSGSFTPNAVTGGTTSTSSSWRSMTLALRPFVAVNHAATGALTGQGSTVAGSAARKRAMATSGALTGAGSTVAGTAARASAAVAHATTGVLTGPGSTVVGSAARTRVHAATGVLAGQVATIAGTAARTHVHLATGVLVGSGAVIAGVAARIGGAVSHAATGALVGASATITGSAARTRVHSSTGVLAGQGSLIVGSAARFRAFASSGVLTGQGSTVAGGAARTGAAINHAATGALVGQSSTVSGVAERTGAAVSHEATGNLVGGGSTLSGSAIKRVNHIAVGSLVGGFAVIQCTAIRRSLYSQGAMVAGRTQASDNRADRFGTDRAAQLGGTRYTASNTTRPARDARTTR